MTRELSNELLIRMYREMLLIRQFEDRVYYLFLQGQLPGTIHLYQGEEAVAVGVCSALREDDVITSTHRPHGHALAKGVPVGSVMAELFGKATGCCRGKGGSMHVGDMAVGSVPAIAVVAAGIPIAGGAALAFKMKGTDRVAACFFGDGATNEGAFHEALNMAAIWDLPAVFVCENNLYGASTHVSYAMKIESISERAGAYGMPGLTVDGNNVMEVYLAVKEAVVRARSGDGPTLIECRTYRQGGHSRSDGCGYRPDDEEEKWRKKDPLLVMKRYLVEKEILSDKECDQASEDVEREIDEAVAFAQSSPDPDPRQAIEDVYA